MDKDVQIQPLVSFLVATYNRVNLVQQCINSIFSQTYGNIEVIVVDDASTDDTEKMMQSEFSGKVKYYKNEQNRGVAYSRNLGLSYARGEYIGLLDSDDLLLDKGHVETAIGIFESGQQIAVFTSDAYCIDLEGNRIYEKTFFETVIDHRDIELVSGAKDFEYIFCHGVHSCGAIFRKDITEAIGFLNTAYKIAWDEDFFLRASACGKKIYYHNEPNVGYRIHNNSFSRNLSGLYREKIKVRESVVRGNNGLKKELGGRLRNRLADQYYCLTDAYLKENRLLPSFLAILKAVFIYPPIISRLIKRCRVFV